MFLRSNHDMPGEIIYPANLPALGYEINLKNQIVKVGHDAEFFVYNQARSSRLNDLHKEAMHECARNATYDALAGLGINQIYLTGSKGTEVATVKPHAAHVSILATEVTELRRKKDVIVVIGEHTQDLGIWSYRVLLNEGGIAKGTAAGLASMAQTITEYKSEDHGEDIDKVLGAAADQKASNPHVELASKLEDSAMGIIVLNPGQLLYSPQSNKCMTSASWFDRPKKDSLLDHTSIDPVWNRIPGHTTPEKHVGTFFNDVLPKITRQDVRIYLVGIADGADAALQCIDSDFVAGGTGGPATKLEAAVFMEPNYQSNAVKSERLQTFLTTNKSHAWTISGLPRGEIVKTSAFSIGKRDAVTGKDGSEGQPHRPEVEAKDIAPLIFASPGNINSKDVGSIEPLMPGLDDPDHSSGDGEAANEAYAYHKEPALCATFSAGSVEYIETIWPNVMADVLQLFRSCQMATDRG